MSQGLTHEFTIHLRPTTVAAGRAGIADGLAQKFPGVTVTPMGNGIKSTLQVSVNGNSDPAAVQKAAAACDGVSQVGRFDRNDWRARHCNL